MLTARLEGLRRRVFPATPERDRTRFLSGLPKASSVAAALAPRVPDPGWRLELTKAALREGFVVLLPGGQGPRARLAALTAEPREDPTELQALRRRFAARFALSTVVALGVWIDSLLSAPQGPPVRLPEDALLIAVHGEVTNRTRHVLRMAAGSGRPVVALILGRPCADLSEIRAQFAEQGLEDAVLLRPLDLSAGLRSLPRALRRAQAGMASMLRTGFAPTWEDEIGILYRILLGETHASWWKALERRGGIVYYGYTGTADVDALERAQQEDGVFTVHCVHGVCDGRNFTGHSSLAVFQCAHDAQVNAGFGTYGLTASLPVRRPRPWIRGAGDWLILTNFVHPTNPFAGQGAEAYEREVIEAVAWAADQLGWPPSRVTWRPHPAFWRMPRSMTAPLLARAEKLGLRVSRAGEPMPDLRDASVVISVASTTVLDALQVGVLPIIYAPQPLSPDVLYAVLPGLARTRAELVAAITVLDDPGRAEDRYQQTHEIAGPGSGGWDLPGLEELVRQHAG